MPWAELKSVISVREWPKTMHTADHISTLAIVQFVSKRVVSITPWPRFTPGERTPGTHCTGGWVGPRAGLDAEARGKILCLYRGSNPSRPVCTQTLYWLSYPSKYPCECGRCYFGKIGRQLGVHIKEHRHLGQCLMEKSKLALLVSWDMLEGSKVLQIEPNNICRKYKESVHMACVANLISLDTSPIWIPIISKEVGSYNVIRFSILLLSYTILMM
jgi:hypothetical protein